jgi:hypothetical protein
MPLPNLPQPVVEIGFINDPLDEVNEYGINDWFDVTDRVRRMSWTRGRPDDLQKVQTGTAEIVLDNLDRAFDPMNTASYVAGYVLPRRQVRVSAFYPNDPTQDGFCYNLVDETSFAPTVGGFSTAGLDYALNTSYDTVNLSTSINLATATNVAVAIRFDRFDGGGYDSTNPLRLFEIGSLCYAYVVSNTVYLKRSSDNATVATASLPSVVASTYKTMWLKFVVAPSAVNNYIFFCPDQFQTPSSWTDITSTRSVGLTFSGTFSGIRASGPDSTVLPGSVNAWTGLQRLAVYLDDGLGTQSQRLDLVPQTRVTVFRGYNSGWKQNYGRDGKDNYVTLNCFDAMGLIGNQNLPVDLVQVEYDKLNAASRGPWGYWKLGESTAAAIDYTENYNDLQTGIRVMTSDALAAGLQGGSSMFGFDKPGVISIAIINPYVNVYSGAIAPSAFNGSVSFWVNTTQDLFSGYASVLFCMNDVTGGYNSGDGHLLVRLLDNGQLRVDMYNTTSPGWGSYGVSTTTINNGISHFVTITTSGLNSYIYIDGILETTFTAKPYWGGYIGIGGYAKPGLSFTDPVGGIANFYFIGLMQEVTLWNNVTLTGAEISAIYQAGFGSIEENTGPRVDRILNSVGIPSWMKAINTTTYGLCGATEYTEDQKVLDAINKIEDTEQGLFYVNREGKFAFLNRYYLSTVDTGINAQAQFDDIVTNIGYRNLEFTYDADQLINDHIVTDDVGEQYQSADDTSITTYGRTSRTIDTLLIETEDARNMAIGLTNIYKTPILRAQPFEIVPLGKQWLDVLPLDLGMRMNIKCTPLGVGSQINQDLALQQLSYTVENKNWTVEVIGSPRPVISYFVLGDGVITEERTNLVQNTKAASTVSPYVLNYGTGTLSRNTTLGRSGTTSFQFVTSDLDAQFWDPTLIAANASTTYTVSCYARKNSGGGTDYVYPYIYFYNSVGTQINAFPGTVATVNTTSWTRVNYTFTPVANTVNLRVGWFVQNNTGGSRTFYLTDMMLEVAPSVRGFFDGDYADAYGSLQNYGKWWTGTANASRSISNWGTPSGYGSELDGPDVLGF